MKIIRKSSKIMAAKYSAEELFKNLSSGVESYSDDYYDENEIIHAYLDEAVNAIYSAVIKVWPSADFTTEHDGQGWNWSQSFLFEFPDDDYFEFYYSDEQAQEDVMYGAKGMAESIWKKFMSNKELVAHMD